MAADTQNTDSSAAKWRVDKIEKLSDGSIFLGSGHLFPIGQCKLWATLGFATDEEPDWTYFQEDPDDRGFQ